MTDHRDDAAEKPLDPAAERLRRKMVRLLAVAVSTLFVGVMAVLAAIVYKLNRDAPPTRDAETETAVTLPEGSRILDMAGNGETALLRLGAPGDGAESLVRIDLATGRILARYRLEGLAREPEPRAGAAIPSGTAPLLDLFRQP